MENKGVSTVSDAFNITDEELEALEPSDGVKSAETTDSPVVNETQQGEVVDKLEESETKEVTDEPKTVEVKKEEIPAETIVKTEEKEPSWAELGLPQYEGLTKKQIAERVATTNREYGRATNTIGELRKQIGSVVNDTIKPKDVVETKKDILASMPNLSESEIIQFNEVFSVNPARAILMFGGDTLKQMFREEIDNKVPQNLNQILEKKAEEQQYHTFLGNHPEITEAELDWMKVVDTEYLKGQNRPYDELYELSQMWKNKTDDVEDVYLTMKRHPTLSLSDAKRLSIKSISNVQPVKSISKESVEKTIKKLNNANHTSQSTQIADDVPDNIDSVQAAFDSVTD